MVGRKKEQKRLLDVLARDEAQLVAVYGRRRIGKTFLVRETFGDTFYFQHAGLARGTLKEQLAAFHDSLIRSGAKDVPALKNWRQAFNALERFIVAGGSRRKKVIFIDEMPWMDTPKSKFVMWFEAFWNGWCSARKDVVMVICGSATSWIVKKVFRNRGGLYNRVTERIHLEPFSLGECRELCRSMRLSLPDSDIAELFMVFGGVPYYWKFLERGKSVAQNIDALCFAKDGQLRHEFEDVFSSLFGERPGYMKIVRALSGHACGMTCGEILSATGMKKGGGVLRMLDALEQSGFIRRYTAFGKKKQDAQSQLVDNFSLFHLKFLDGESNPDEHFWSHATIGPVLNTWRGLAFERLCLQHIAQIKRALGISGVLTRVFSWRHAPDDVYDRGVQIDLLIERADNVVNVCEMKYSRKPFVIDKAYDGVLRHKAGAIMEYMKNKIAAHITMITANGLAHNGYWGTVQSEVSLEDLFYHEDC